MQTARDPYEIIADQLQPILTEQDASERATAIIIALDEAAAAEAAATGYRALDIVQVKPEVGDWAGALVVVTEPKSWGIVGYTQIPHGGQAFIRLEHAQIEPTGGRAVFAS